jgi:hypothetical protein
MVNERQRVVARDRVTLARNCMWTFDRSDLLALMYLASWIRICNSDLRIRIPAIRQRFKEILLLAAWIWIRDSGLRIRVSGSEGYIYGSTSLLSSNQVHVVALS